jgi:hypothetical protein
VLDRPALAAATGRTLRLDAALDSADFEDRLRISCDCRRGIAR